VSLLAMQDVTSSTTTRQGSLASCILSSLITRHMQQLQQAHVGLPETTRRQALNNRPCHCADCCLQSSCSTAAPVCGIPPSLAAGLCSSILIPNPPNADTLLNWPLRRDSSMRLFTGPLSLPTRLREAMSNLCTPFFTGGAVQTNDTAYTSAVGRLPGSAAVRNACTKLPFTAADASRSFLLVPMPIRLRSNDSWSAACGAIRPCADAGHEYMLGFDGGGAGC
jgi:hypothetical protein